MELCEQIKLKRTLYIDPRHLIPTKIAEVKTSDKSKSLENMRLQTITNEMIIKEHKVRDLLVLLKKSNP